MKATRFTARFVGAVALLAVIAAGATALVGDAVAKGPCICPKIYAPVICDNGKTYSNLCVAECRHATGCVPTGIPLAR